MAPDLINSASIFLRDLLVSKDLFERSGLAETPKRYATALEAMLSGYGVDPPSLLKTFEDGAASYDQMVFQAAIPIYSLCEHHVLPFFGSAHVAYIPRGRIVGLSKISRVVDAFARRLQVQERLTTEIADCLSDTLDPIGVGVVIQCRHFCMEARGVQKQGTVTSTCALRGAMKDEDAARAEFLAFVRTSPSNV